MKSTVEPLEGNKVKLSVEVDEAEFDKAIDAAFRKLAREVRLPGFRPGKAPRRVLEARIGVAPAREQALHDAIPEYLARAVREHDVDIIAPPEIDITKGEDDGPVAFDATIEVRPIVSVPGYGGLRVELPALEVSDDEVDERIAAFRRPYGELADSDAPAARGDYVTLDLNATRDGEPVAGLTTEDWLYEVGRGWIADDFDDYVIGSTAGDRREFSSVPKGTEEPADFVVEVKKVQTLALPELTDEWVQENIDGVETVGDWRDKLREQLEMVRLMGARQNLVERSLTALAGLVDEEAPEALVDDELRHRAQHTVERLAQQGIGLEQYLAMTGMDQASFVEGLRSEAINAVKSDLALRAVADAEQLEADDDDLEREYARIAVQVNQKPNQVRKAYERNDAVGTLKSELRKRKALEWLLRHVEVVDPEGHEIDRQKLLPDTDIADAAAEATEHDHHDHDHDHVEEEHA